jgi:hypothetical protein
MGQANRDLVTNHHQARVHAEELVGLFRRLAPNTAPVTTANRELSRSFSPWMLRVVACFSVVVASKNSLGTLATVTETRSEGPDGTGVQVQAAQPLSGAGHCRLASRPS